jgi:hypothetical protein
LYGRFCPYNPPYKPGEKTAPLLFLEDENFLQKSARLVLILLKFHQRGRFLKKVLIFEKMGGADAF